MNTYSTHRLVKGEDLNHHGTLFAGRASEWFVESGFIAVSSVLPPKNVVCFKIHGLTFKRPIKPGETLCYRSKIVFTGRTSLRVYVKVHLINHEDDLYVEGFITFIHVDDETKAAPHNINVIPQNEEEKKLFDMARTLR